MDPEHTRLRDLALSDTGFVFDPMTGHTFTVNLTRQLALRCLKDGMGPEAIAGRIAEELASEGVEDFGRDVHDFIQQLRDCGLAK